MTLRRRTVLGFAVLTALAPQWARAAAPEIIGGVKKLSPKLDALIDPDAKVEKLVGGIQWAEGPVWVKRGGYLLFSDPPANVMRKWSKTGGVSEFLKPSGLKGEDPTLREAGSNGLTFDRQGRLLIADSGDRSIVRLDLGTMERQTVAAAYQAKRFNSPNDVVASRWGAIYFTDPPYGLKGLDASPARELPYAGIYCITPDRIVHLVDKSLTFPNGLALSPDEKTLYVSCSDAKSPRINAYALGADGLPTSSKLFFDAKPLVAKDAPGNPDGMKVDNLGNLFASGPGGIMILTPEAELLGVIGAGRAIANCAFGEDGKTLFLTASDSVARVRLRTSGPIPG